MRILNSITQGDTIRTSGLTDSIFRIITGFNKVFMKECKEID